MGSIAEQIALIAGLAQTPPREVRHVLLAVANKSAIVGTTTVLSYTISKSECLLITNVRINSVPKDSAGIPVYSQYKHDYPWGGASIVYWDRGTSAASIPVTPLTNSWLQITGDQFLVFAPGLKLRLRLSRDFLSGSEPTTILLDCRISAFLLPANSYNLLRLYSTNYS
jgi:hypothetical protein